MPTAAKKPGGESAYLRLYKRLRGEIVSGALPAGSRLPSKRTLAGETGLSLITVEHALALLCDEGYAEARPRSGVYAAGGGSAPPSPRRAALEDMSTGDDAPEDFPFSVWARTMRAVLTDYDRRILSRSPSCGCSELRLALTGYLERSRGLRVRPEQLVVGAGAEYLYGLVVQLLGRERRYALEDPCYDRIRRVYEANGAVCEALPMGEDGIVSAALAGSGAGVLHVTPFHSYPSGVTATAAKRHEYAAWAVRRGVCRPDRADRDDLLARAGAGAVPQHLFQDPGPLGAHGLSRAAGAAAARLPGAAGLLLLHGAGLRPARAGGVHHAGPSGALYQPEEEKAAGEAERALRRVALSS